MTKHFACYENYKDSNVEWLGEIPANWEIKRVKSLFRLIVDPAPINNQQILLSLYTDIGVKPRAELEERGNKASTTDGYLQVKKSDIVVNKLLAWMGAVGVSNYDGVTSPAYDIIRPFKQINSVFYHYLFRNQIFVQEMKRYSRGIMDMRLRLYFDKFGEIFLPVPTFQEQVNIVQYIEKVEFQINEAIAQKEKMIELLKEYRQVTINNAVTKGLDPNVSMKDSGIEWLGQIPAHWEVKKIKFILKQMSVKVSAKNSNHKYIGMENIESWSGKYIETSIETEGDATQFHENCVLFGKLRPYLAKVFLSGFDGICSSEFMVFDILQAEPRYILNLLLSKNFINIVDSSTYGSKMPRANPDYINNLLVPSPSKKEQKQIADFLDKKMSQFDDAISLKQLEIKKLKEYKTTLIDSAVTGKIKV